MPTAQNVIANMNSMAPVGLPNVNSIGGVLSQVQDLQRKKEADPAIQQTQADLDKSLAESTQKADEISKKIDTAGVDLANQTRPWDEAKESAKYQTDPMKAFGSTASMFAILASAFTHQPLINGLNGAAAAMNAIKKGDDEAYQRAYDAYKENMDTALKRHNAMMDDYRTAMETLKEKPDLLNAKMKSLAAKYDDQIMMKMTDEGLIKDRADLQLKREQVGIQMMEAKAKLVPFEIYNQGLKDFKDKYGRRPTAQEQSQIWQESQGMPAVSSGEVQSLGAQAATGMPLNQIVPGYGKQAVAMRQMARTAAIQQIMTDNPGMTEGQAGVELANRSVAFQSGRKSIGQLTTMLGATKQAVEQLDFNIDKTTQEMKKLGSSNISPVINAIARGEEKWTGEPAYSSLFYYMHASAVESARILSGGQASVAQLHQGAMEEAKQWASINMTPASWDAVGTSMKDEGNYRLQTYQDAIKYQQFGPKTAAPGISGGVQAVSTKSEYDALPPGAHYSKPGDPPGSWRVKP